MRILNEANVMLFTSEDLISVISPGVLLLQCSIIYVVIKKSEILHFNIKVVFTHRKDYCTDSDHKK